MSINLLPHISSKYVLAPDYKLPRKKRNLNRIESICCEILNNLFGKYFTKQRPYWLKNPLTGKIMELDLYNKELKIAVEYQGIQHYIWPNYMRQTKQKFLDGVERDKYKKSLCKKKGITLILIPFIVANSCICSYIKKQLKTKKINYCNDYKYVFQSNIFQPKVFYSTINDQLKYSVKNLKTHRRNSSFNIYSNRLYVFYNSIFDIEYFRKFIKKKLSYIKYLSIITIQQKTYLMIFFNKKVRFTNYKLLYYEKSKAHFIRLGKHIQYLEKYHYILDKK